MSYQTVRCWRRLMQHQQQLSVARPREFAMDSSVALLRFLFLVAPHTRRCCEKTGDEYHPNNQRPRRMIPKGVNEHDDCNHAAAKQKFPMAVQIRKFSHTGKLKPRRICCEKIFARQNPRPKISVKNY